MLRVLVHASLSGIVLLAAACGGEPHMVVVGNSEPFIGPEGTRQWAIECKVRPANCWRQAGKTCPHGYYVMERDGQTLSSYETESSAVAWGGGNVATQRGRSTTRERRDFQGSMVIKCRAAPPPTADAVLESSAPTEAGSVDAGSPLAEGHPSLEAR